MKRGLYRNTLGRELEVVGYVANVGRIRCLPGIFEAVSHDELFGSETWLVTPESMEGAGYELIEEKID